MKKMTKSGEMVPMTDAEEKVFLTAFGAICALCGVAACKLWPLIFGGLGR